jgi:hypothetical protein
VIGESDLICFNCHRRPGQIEEYVDAAAEASEWNDRVVTPAEYVMQEEGTLNKFNGHFACTECYIRLGSPSAPPPGWKAP